MGQNRQRGADVNARYHVPVLCAEALALLAPEGDEVHLDVTVGGGGHAAALLPALGPTGRLLGLDRDPEALAATRARLPDPRLTLVQRSFAEVETVLAELDLAGVDGLLADLGVSSHQLDTAQRGFGFSLDGPLDMRMDPDGPGPSAADLVAQSSVEELQRIFSRYGEEPRARAAARAVVRARSEAPIRTTEQLATVLARTLSRGKHTRRHPATLCFQGLRIAVNQELEALETLLAAAPTVLRPGGRLVVISYHSLEDRRVKQGLQGLGGVCTCPPRLPRCGCGATSLGTVLTPRVVKPSPEEVAANPRARSARLRAFRLQS